MLTLFLAAVLALDIPPLPSADTTQARWLADLDPATLKSGTVSRWIFVPGSRPDDVTGAWQVEAAGPGDVLRTIQCARGESDAGLDVAESLIVEGELVVIRHPARGEFLAVVEVQVRQAQRVRN